MEKRNIHTKHRRMLMNTQRPKRILRGIRCGNRIIQAQIPETDLAVATTRDQLAQAASLHVHVGDPLLVLAPDLDHGRCGFQALIEDADCAVAEARDEDVARHLVGC